MSRLPNHLLVLVCLRFLRSQSREIFVSLLDSILVLVEPPPFPEIAQRSLHFSARVLGVGKYFICINTQRLAAAYARKISTPEAQSI